ncbi:MAG: RagB/SusD family nutrient uptake outer membrane protein [Bacteroidetes bacterium]|uniref:RagB/SusD family nutrient uptake outer membrane protein n=1 Tax=Candidatus Cryptobacteroides intestinavium TaxID=2840766 RepID=A0A9D9ERI2_9BACT|nr:RagB/SusD family nutrient uptake outer membrane protein [Candidatus Cryptobacteroides intestinavium]
MKYNRILIPALSLLPLAACTDMLDIAPANQIASANMWSTESLADKGMAGLYENFYRDDLSRIQLRYEDMAGLNRQGWMGMEFQCDFVSDNYHLRALSDATKDASEFVVWYEWQWCYTSIHRINDALANLHKAGLSTEKLERYICEARFLRAWTYSRLNKIYGGVPLYLEVISEDQCTRSQSTAVEVWNAVITDLNYCIDSPYCPVNTLTENYGRPSKGAAYSLRGMAYMWLAYEAEKGSQTEYDAAYYYQQAVNDFEMVDDCGYGLWAGKFIDFFNYTNEKDHEMIFPLQYNTDAGYCDNLQLIIGGRDTWNSWSNARPSSDFVDYFQNADGTVFHWVDVIPEWEDQVFVDNPAAREVFFLRNGIHLDADGTVIQDNWDRDQAGIIQERIDRVVGLLGGLDEFNRYYLPDGNEDRVRRGYADRDPRLKDIVLTPYEPYDTFKDATDNGGQIQIGKELRWPFLVEGDDYGDYYIGTYNNMFVFKKYSYNKPDDLIDRLRCPTDWPLIRYTDVVLQLAEAYVHVGRSGDAVAIVNQIRARAGMPNISVGSDEEVMEAIRYERRVELCLEGHDFFDEWRWGTYKEMKFQGLERYGGQNWWGEWDGYDYYWYYTDDMYPWAAPAQECQRNPNLKQKPGWAY